MSHIALHEKNSGALKRFVFKVNKNRTYRSLTALAQKSRKSEILPKRENPFGQGPPTPFNKGFTKS